MIIWQCKINAFLINILLGHPFTCNSFHKELSTEGGKLLSEIHKHSNSNYLYKGKYAFLKSENLPRSIGFHGQNHWGRSTQIHQSNRGFPLGQVKTCSLTQRRSLRLPPCRMCSGITAALMGVSGVVVLSFFIRTISGISDILSKHNPMPALCQCYTLAPV